MRQLVLHVGSIKTGSTSAQATFAASRKALAAHGLHYSRISRNHGALSRIIRAVRRHGFVEDAPPPGLSAKESADFAAMKRASREAAKIASGTYMLSSEALLGLPAENVALLKKVAEHYFPGFTVRILIYIRHPLGYTISRAQNAIKLADDTTASVEADGYDGELRRGVETFERVFGREALIVRSYDALAAAGRSVQEDMVEAIGHPGAVDGIEIQRSNEAISMNAALVADVVNPALKARRIVIDTDVRRVKKQLLSAVPGPRFAFHRAALERIGEPCRAEAAWFAEAYQLVLHEPKLVAREDIAAELMDAEEVEERAGPIVEAILAEPDKAKARNVRRSRRTAGGKTAGKAKTAAKVETVAPPRQSLLAKLLKRLKLRP